MLRWVEKLTNVCKQALWLQLLWHRLWGKFFRYYGLMSLVSLLAVGGTLAIVVFHPPVLLKPFGTSLVVCGCGLLTVVAYVVARAASKWILPLAGALVSGAAVVTPVLKATRILSPDDTADSSVLTADTYLFLKGMVIYLALAGLSIGFYMSLRRRAKESGKYAPLRRFVVLTVLATTLVSLELLRITVPLDPLWGGLYRKAVLWVLSEPGWPYALVTWVWLTVAYLWAEYDSYIIPHLLRRTGLTFVHDRLTIHEGYLVDRLVKNLAQSD